MHVNYLIEVTEVLLGKFLRPLFPLWGVLEHLTLARPTTLRIAT
jgi:hypothetical protein